MSEVLLRYVAVALEIKPAKQFVYLVLSAQASLRFELISELGNWDVRSISSDHLEAFLSAKLVSPDAPEGYLELPLVGNDLLEEANEFLVL